MPARVSKGEGPAVRAGQFILRDGPLARPPQDEEHQLHVTASGGASICSVRQLRNAAMSSW